MKVDFVYPQLCVSISVNGLAKLEQTLPSSNKGRRATGRSWGEYEGQRHKSLRNTYIISTAALVKGFIILRLACCVYDDIRGIGKKLLEQFKILTELSSQIG